MKPRLLIDALMLAVLLLLMPYLLIGEELHEILGVAMFVLFAIHQYFNRKWYKVCKFNLQTAINFLLLILMILQMASGVFISIYLFDIDIYGGASTARNVHLAGSVWLLIFVSIHLGAHFNLLKTQLKIKSSKLLKILAGAISIYGIYAFINRKLFDYMFLKSEFVFWDFSENPAFVVADCLAVMILFSCIGYKLKK